MKGNSLRPPEAKNYQGPTVGGSGRPPHFHRVKLVFSVPCPKRGSCFYPNGQGPGGRGDRGGGFRAAGEDICGGWLQLLGRNRRRWRAEIKPPRQEVEAATDERRPRGKKVMNVVYHQRPSATGGRCLYQDLPRTAQTRRGVLGVLGDGSELDSADDRMGQCPRRTGRRFSCPARHCAQPG